MTVPETVKIIPAGVPWAVDPSAPGVTLAASDEEMPSMSLNAEFLDASTAGDAIASRLQVVFEGPGGWVRVSPGAHESRLDYSAVAVVPNLAWPRGEFSRRVRAHLRETGEHPFPGFFKVVDSSWIAMLGLVGRGIEHFIVLGDETMWEVLARGFSWRRLS